MIYLPCLILSQIIAFEKVSQPSLMQLIALGMCLFPQGVATVIHIGLLYTYFYFLLEAKKLDQKLLWRFLVEIQF